MATAWVGFPEGVVQRTPEEHDSVFKKHGIEIFDWYTSVVSLYKSAIFHTDIVMKSHMFLSYVELYKSSGLNLFDVLNPVNMSLFIHVLNECYINLRKRGYSEVCFSFEALDKKFPDYQILETPLLSVLVKTHLGDSATLFETCHSPSIEDIGTRKKRRISFEEFLRDECENIGILERIREAADESLKTMSAKRDGGFPETSRASSEGVNSLNHDTSLALKKIRDMIPVEKNEKSCEEDLEESPSERRGSLSCDGVELSWKCVCTPKDLEKKNALKLCYECLGKEENFVEMFYFPEDIDFDSQDPYLILKRIFKIHMKTPPRVLTRLISMKDDDRYSSETYSGIFFCQSLNAWGAFSSSGALCGGFFECDMEAALCADYLTAHENSSESLNFERDEMMGALRQMQARGTRTSVFLGDKIGYDPSCGEQ